MDDTDVDIELKHKILFFLNQAYNKLKEIAMNKDYDPEDAKFIHSLEKNRVFNNQHFLIKKNSKEAIGFQIDFLENGFLSDKKKIYFLEIKSISDFFKEFKKNIGRKIEKQEVSKIKLGYEFYVDTLFLLNDEVHFSVESIKPNFSNVLAYLNLAFELFAPNKVATKRVLPISAEADKQYPAVLVCPVFMPSAISYVVSNLFLFLCVMLL